MKKQKIPFNQPFIVGRELRYIEQAVKNGNIGGDGEYTKLCASVLENQFNIHRVLMTPSCTAALEMAATLCNLGPGDEVIMPSYTFVSTANAVVLQGAKPVFVDIRPDTLNIDENLIESAITSHTKAIFVVHYAGVSCEMDQIMEISKKHKLIVVEDAAQGVNAFYKGRALGSIGDLGTYSFHETKNYICGEGGSLCINTPGFVDRSEIIRDKGTNRQKFMRGMTDKYTWVDIGSSHVPSEIASAFLYGQLEQLDIISERREELYNYYYCNLKALEQQSKLRLPHIPDECTSNYHLFYLILNSPEERNELMEWMNKRGCNSVFHYVPLHSSPMGEKLGCNSKPLPVTEILSARLLRLPMFFNLKDDMQRRVVDSIYDYFLGKSMNEKLQSVEIKALENA